MEVKFYIRDLPRLGGLLHSFGAELVQPRTHEINFRFDAPDGRLRRGQRVLRLRQDRAVTVTYKGPGRIEGGVRIREEIQFHVDDFEAAKAFLEALDFQASLMYEKYRAEYRLGKTLVSLDELPFGDFSEIEGASTTEIKEVSQKLGLDWRRSIPESYTALFERLCEAKGYTFRDLTFANFQILEVTGQDLKLEYADK